MLALLFLAAITLAMQPTQARSCSDFKAVCLVRAVNKSLFDGAWNMCMRTGIYIGPESHTNHGQAEKN